MDNKPISFLGRFESKFPQTQYYLLMAKNQSPPSNESHLQYENQWKNVKNHQVIQNCPKTLSPKFLHIKKY